MLDKKQEQQFIDFYKGLYGDTSKETGTGQLPHIPADKEQEHIELWKKELTKIIGPIKSKRKYIHKGGREDTILGKVFADLWLCYSPILDFDKQK